MLRSLLLTPAPTSPLVRVLSRLVIRQNLRWQLSIAHSHLFFPSDLAYDQEHRQQQEPSHGSERLSDIDESEHEGDREEDHSDGLAAGSDAVSESEQGSSPSSSSPRVRTYSAPHSQTFPLAPKLATRSATGPAATTSSNTGAVSFETGSLSASAALAALATQSTRGVARSGTGIQASRGGLDLAAHVHSNSSDNQPGEHRASATSRSQSGASLTSSNASPLLALTEVDYATAFAASTDTATRVTSSSARMEEKGVLTPPPQPETSSFDVNAALIESLPVSQRNPTATSSAVPAPAASATAAAAAVVSGSTVAGAPAAAGVPAKRIKPVTGASSLWLLTEFDRLASQIAVMGPDAENRPRAGSASAAVMAADGSNAQKHAHVQEKSVELGEAHDMQQQQPRQSTANAHPALSQALTGSCLSTSSNVLSEGSAPTAHESGESGPDVRRKSFQLAMQGAMDDRFFPSPARPVTTQPVIAPLPEASRNAAASHAPLPEAPRNAAASHAPPPPSAVTFTRGDALAPPPLLQSQPPAPVPAPLKSRAPGTVSPPPALTQSTARLTLESPLFDVGPSFVSVPVRRASGAATELGMYPGVSQEYSQPPHRTQGREQHEVDHAAASSQAQRALRFGEIMRYSLKNGGDREEEEDDLEGALSDDPLGSDMGELGDESIV
jgi:hypothetical protein